MINLLMCLLFLGRLVLGGRGEGIISIFRHSILAFYVTFLSCLTFYSSILSGVFSDIFWHPIWNPFWLLFWHSILAFYVASILTFFLRSVLAFYMASCLASILFGSLSMSIGHSVWHSLWHEFGSKPTPRPPALAIHSSRHPERAEQTLGDGGEEEGSFFKI